MIKVPGKLLKHKKYSNTSKVIDKFITTSRFIIPLFILLILVIFEITFTFGNYIAGLLDYYLNELYSLANFNSTLPDTIFGGIAGILVFLPNIIILYFFLFILNNSGLLPRIAYVFDKHLKKIGLTGSSFLPLFMGFGCTIPSILATKNVDNPKERILAIMMLPFVSCSAKIPVFVLFISIFIPAGYQGVSMLAIYIVGILFGIFSNFLLSRIIKHKSNTFEINLPRYKIPSFGKIFKEIFKLLKEFFVKIAVFILPFSLILTLAFTYPLESKIEDTYGGKVGEALHVVFEPLGFNREMSIAIIAGLIGKEITVSTLGSLYYIQDDDSEGLKEKIEQDNSVTLLGSISFLLFILLYSPCVGAIFTARRVLGNLGGFVFFAYPLAFAWIMSFIVYSLLNKIL